jgi:hypothetical protein
VNLAGTYTSAPSCTGDGAGGAVCAALTTVNHALVAFRYNGTVWSAALNIAGEASSAPNCAKLGLPGQVVCFALGRDSAVWGRRFNGGTWSIANWSPWASIGGVAFTEPSCTSTGANQMVCGVVATTDSALYANQWNGSAWLGWVKTGASAALRAPSCVGLTTGKALCAFTTVPNKAASTVGP